jgi:hypothetical protein
MGKGMTEEEERAERQERKKAAVEEIRKKWPETLPFPAALGDYLDFELAHPEQWSNAGGSLEIGGDDYHVTDCPGGAAVGKRYAVFARAGDGSTWGVWDDGAGHLPVLYVDSDGGCGPRLVAADMEDFLDFLATGATGEYSVELGASDEELDEIETDEAPPDFVDWVRARAQGQGRGVRSLAEIRQRVEDLGVANPQPWLVELYGWDNDGSAEEMWSSDPWR